MPGFSDALCDRQPPPALVILTMALVSGILVGQRVGMLAAGMVALLAGVLALVLVYGKRQGTALVCGAFSLGLLANGGGDPAPEEDPFPTEPVVAQGTVVSAPSANPTGDGVVLRLILDHPFFGHAVQVVTKEPLIEVLLPGDRVRFYCRLRVPRPLVNPVPSVLHGQRAPKAENAAHCAVTGGNLALLEGQGTSPGLVFSRTVARVRSRLAAVLSHHLAQTERLGYALLSALVLGQRGELAHVKSPFGRSVETSFRDAGIVHLLSVSGLHLAVVAYLVYRGFGLCMLHLPWISRRIVAGRLAAALSIPVTIFYTLLTGAEVATVRACGVACLWFFARALGRRTSLSICLSTALLLILCTNPLALFDPSLQLSVAAVLGCAYLQPLRMLLAPYLQEPIPTVGKSKSWTVRLSFSTLRLVDASLSATLSTLPLCALHFSSVPLAGIVGNLVAIPLGEWVVVPMGLGGTLLALVWPALGGLLLFGAAKAALGLVYVADLLSFLGWTLLLPTPSTPAVLFYGLALVCFVLVSTRAGVGVLCVSLVFWAVPFLPGTDLVVTFLSVGQGDAAVLELPHRKVVVVDAGPGVNGVLPFLRQRGYKKVDLLVLSHPHPDHIGGVAAILREMQVGALWTTVLPTKLQERGSHVGTEPLDAAYLEILQLAKRAGVPVAAPSRQTIEGVTLMPLSPFGQGPDRGALSHADLGHNNNSLTLLAQYQGRSLLFAGDLELEGELRLLGDAEVLSQDLQVDVLKVPHHCSKTSSSGSFVLATKPQVAICSVGYRNRYGFPDEEVVARYRVLGTKVLRLDLDGAVTARVSREGTLQITLAVADRVLRLEKEAR